MNIDIAEGCYIYQRAGSKKGTWQLYLYRDGEEIKASLGTGDVEVAKQIAKARIKDIEKRKEQGKTLTVFTFDDLARKYIASNLTTKMVDSRKEKNRKDAKRVIENYFTPYFGKRKIDVITDNMISSYPDWRKNKRLEMAIDMKESQKPMGYLRDELSPSTLNNEIALLNKIFNFAVKQEFLFSKDVPKIKRVSLDGQHSRLGLMEDEFQLIRKTAKERFQDSQGKAVKIYLERVKKISEDNPLYAHMVSTAKSSGKGWVHDREAWGRFQAMCLIDLMAGTGLRPISISWIERQHVIARGRILVETTRFFDSHDSAYFPYLIRGKTFKGGKKRELNVVPRNTSGPAIRMLLTHIGNEPTSPIMTMAPPALNDAFKKIAETCGLGHHSVYDLRHYYITQALLAGVSVAKVASNSLTSIQMIERYYNHLKAEMAYDELSSF